MSSLRVLIVDDHEAVRNGVRTLLASSTHWSVCGEASDGVEAVEKAKRLCPDVVLMDVSMPRMDGIEATRIIRREVPESDVIIVSQNDPVLMQKVAVEAGAKAFVEKSRIVQDLLRVIEALEKNGAGVIGNGQSDRTAAPAAPVNLVKVRGTELLASDTRERYRQKIARITLDSMVQFVGLLDAEGTVLEINHVALDAVGVKLSDVEARPFWTTFWWQVSNEVNATLREMIRRASQGEFVRWDTEIYGRAGGKDTIIIDASLMPVKDEQGRVVFITAEGRDITELARVRSHLAMEKTRREAAATERELRAAAELERNQIREMFMQAPAAIGRVSGPEHRWTFVNAGYLRVTGRDRADQFIGKTIRESLPELEGQEFFELLDTVYRTGVPYVGAAAKAVLNRTATGQPEEAYFNFVYQPLRDLEGKSQGILIHAVEVTNQEIARQEIEKRERATSLLAAIVSSSDDAIISKTLDGTITSWNTSAERLFGYTAQEAIGQHITLIIPEDRRDEEVKILQQVSRGECFDHFETIRQRKDGTLVALSLTISPVKDAAGRIIGASKVARDITERKRIEQALSERATLLDLSNDAIFVRDASDRITYWNKSASELYGYSRDEAMGRVTHELLRTEFPEPLERIVEQLHRDNRWAGELVHRRKNGAQIVVASRWALDKDEEGNRKCILETNNDITEQKQNDKALRESEERLRALSDSLEIQVRVRTEELERRNVEVLQQSEQLRELSNRLLKTQDDERRHIARELHDSAGQLIAALGMNLAGINRHGKENPMLAEALEDTQNLVQQLNKEIRTTSYLLHPPLLDENGLSQAIQWYMQGLMERGGLAIELHIAEDFGRLPADLELAVFRIVQESLTNIHRHSGSKTATIRLSRSIHNVLLEIEDHGKGISGEKLAAIKAQRTGVGITGMRERVRHLKGEMDIQSNGTGATILVTLPLPPAPASGSEVIQSSEAIR